MKKHNFCVVLPVMVNLIKKYASLSRYGLYIDKNADIGKACRFNHKSD